jgi:hypothetical protein
MVSKRVGETEEEYKIRQKEWQKEFRKKNPQYYKEWYVRNRKKELIRSSRWKKENREKVNKRWRKYYPEYRKRIRLEVLNHYSNGTMKCACEECYYHAHDCPIEFLTIDHINNDGYKEGHKREHVCEELRSRNYPEGYQVLCMNCNFGKRMNDGICPHKRISQPKPS